MPLAIDLTGRKAVVSGVSSGIGAGIAVALGQAGCDVAGCGLEAADHPGSRAFSDAMIAQGRRCFYKTVDLSHPESPAKWVHRAAEQLGGIDIVVACAGKNVFTGVAQCTEDDWTRCMEVDLASHWRVARAAYAYLRSSPAGVVILITSNHADRTISGCFPYNVAKSGANAMVQSLAIEWGPHIRAVGIAPGFIDTPGNDVWFQSFPDPAAERKKTEQRHPVDRLGSAAEIGALCAFLASEHAAFISGTVITVDGGRGAMLQD